MLLDHLSCKQIAHFGILNFFDLVPQFNTKTVEICSASPLFQVDMRHVGFSLWRKGASDRFSDLLVSQPTHREPMKVNAYLCSKFPRQEGWTVLGEADMVDCGDNTMGYGLKGVNRMSALGQKWTLGR